MIWILIIFYAVALVPKVPKLDKNFVICYDISRNKFNIFVTNR